MGDASRLPFKVGDRAESRSFEPGYRGSWFRCKIKEIRVKKGVTSYLLEYYDFEDEVEWTKVYQYPAHLKGKHKQKELMLRPEYPDTTNKNSNVVVVFDSSWKVGDLVEWKHSECHWTGTITDLFEDDKGKMLLTPCPAGEGGSYDIEFRDVRPALDWSPELGWTLPSRGNSPACSCARLIKLSNQVPHAPPTMDTSNANDKTEADLGASSAGLSLTSPVSSDSLSATDDAKSKHTADTQTRSLGLPVLTELKAEVAEDSQNSSSPSKRCKVSNQDGLCSDHDDSLEAAILDLEEHLSKVKWLQRILKHGIVQSNTPSSQWKFLEPGAPS